MLYKKLKKIPLSVWIGGYIIVFVSLFVPFFYTAHDWLMAESYDYMIAGDMHKIAKKLKDYKQLHGSYPQDIQVVRDTDQLCYDSLGRSKCTTIHYKPSADLQNFKIAIDTNPVSGSWPVLYYDPAFSMTPEEEHLLTEEQRNAIIKTYGNICWFCSSDHPVRAAKESDKSKLLIYKQDPKKFPHPGEWPDLP